MAEIYATADQILASWPGLPTAGRDDLVEDANAAVRDWLRRDILLADRVERYNGPGLPELFLRARPVVSIDRVSIDDWGDQASWTVDPAVGVLYLGGRRGDPRFATRWPRGVQNVEVAYSAGLAAVPPPVRRAVVLTAQRLYEAGEKTGYMTSESIGDYSYTLADGLHAVPDVAQGLLVRYQEGPLF